MSDRISLKPFFSILQSLIKPIGGGSETTVAALGEADGTARVQLVGWDGAAERVAVETDGSVKMVVQGKDSGGTIDPLRTNAAQQLQVEVVSEIGAQTAKVLGTADPTAAANTNLYTVPAATSTKVTSFSVTNRSGTPTSIRVGIDVGGAGTNTPSTAEWIYYDTAIAANVTTFLLPGTEMWLAATDDLVVFATLATLSFVATGIEYA